MNEPLDPLPDDLAALIASEKVIEPLALDSKSRMLCRLAAVVPLSPDIGGDSSASPSGDGAGVTAAVSSTWKAKIALSVASLTIGAGFGAGGHAVFSSTPQPTGYPVEEPKPALVSKPNSAVTVEAPASGSVSFPSPSSAAPPVLSVVASVGRKEASTPGDADLRRERAFIDRARVAMSRNDHAEAVAALRSHAAVFPHGRLAEERQVLLVKALRAGGNASEADTAAREFKKQFPDSLSGIE